MPESKFEQIKSYPASPETGLDKSWEQAVSNLEAAKPINTAPLAQVLPTPANPNPQTSPSYKDAKLIEIENVLEQDLAQIYFDLPPESKQIFKSEGELTARKINALLLETKVAAQKIVTLIVNWLAMLPGVNKFFIEQEAKIKADKILAMKLWTKTC